MPSHCRLGGAENLVPFGGTGAEWTLPTADQFCPEVAVAVQYMSAKTKQQSILVQREKQVPRYFQVVEAYFTPRADTPSSLFVTGDVPNSMLWRLVKLGARRKFLARNASG